MADALDNPSTYVGKVASREDMVALVLNPGTADERIVYYAPLVAQAIAIELVKYAQAALDEQARALSRKAQRAVVSMVPPDLRHSRKLDS